MARTLVNVTDSPSFDPKVNVRFRGRPLDALTREELIEALDQVLREVHRLRQLYEG